MPPLARLLFAASDGSSISIGSNPITAPPLGVLIDTLIVLRGAFIPSVAVVLGSNLAESQGYTAAQPPSRLRPPLPYTPVPLPSSAHLQPAGTATPSDEGGVYLGSIQHAQQLPQHPHPHPQQHQQHQQHQTTAQQQSAFVAADGAPVRVIIAVCLSRFVIVPACCLALELWLYNTGYLGAAGGDQDCTHIPYAIRHPPHPRRRLAKSASVQTRVSLILCNDEHQHSG